jgi:ribosomal-protein-alanine N-acetyltransferase
VIKRATPSDAAALAAFENRCFTIEDWRLNRRVFYYHLRRKNYLIKAEIDGAIAGYALVFTAKNSGWARLYAIGVDPFYRRRGVGRALLAEAIDYARRIGKRRIFLEVRADNLPAIRLYEKFGFCTIARLKAYYPLGANGLKMNLELQ